MKRFEVVFVRQVGLIFGAVGLVLVGCVQIDDHDSSVAVHTSQRRCSKVHIPHVPPSNDSYRHVLRACWAHQIFRQIYSNYFHY